MSSPAQAAASAANALLSTGPRTDAGKARSSRNAVKHGLTSKQLVIAPGQEDEFADFHESLFTQLAPEGALEMGLFNMLVHAAWNLQRFRTLEAQLMTNGLESLLDEPTAKALDRLQRYASSNQRAYYAALKELRTVQNQSPHPRHSGGPRRFHSRTGLYSRIVKTNPPVRCPGPCRRMAGHRRLYQCAHSRPDAKRTRQPSYRPAPGGRLTGGSALLMLCC
jgi:hypothetical protein